VVKPEGKRQFGRPRRRWVNIIRMDLREIEWDGLDWIDLFFVNTVMNLPVP
jgi:hypothetical protein